MDRPQSRSGHKRERVPVCSSIAEVTVRLRSVRGPEDQRNIYGENGIRLDLAEKFSLDTKFR
jgi:hypothetical protein